MDLWITTGLSSTGFGTVPPSPSPHLQWTHAAQQPALGPAGQQAPGRAFVLCPEVWREKSWKEQKLIPAISEFDLDEYSQIKVRSHSGLCLFCLVFADIWPLRGNIFLEIGRIHINSSKCTWSLFCMTYILNYMNIIHMQYIDILYPDVSSL